MIFFLSFFAFPLRSRIQMMQAAGIVSGKFSIADMIIHVPLVPPTAPLNCFRILLMVPIISITDMIQNLTLTGQQQQKGHSDDL